MSFDTITIYEIMNNVTIYEIIMNLFCTIVNCFYQNEILKSFIPY